MNDEQTRRGLHIFRCSFEPARHKRLGRERLQRPAAPPPPPPPRFSDGPVSFAFRTSPISLETVSKVRQRSKPAYGTSVQRSDKLRCLIWLRCATGALAMATTSSNGSGSKVRLSVSWLMDVGVKLRGLDARAHGADECMACCRSALECAAGRTPRTTRA